MSLKLPPAYRLIERDAVGNSNDEAKALARAGAEDGTLLWVRQQSAGKAAAAALGTARRAISISR